jgi:hypothetical protein
VYLQPKHGAVTTYAISFFLFLVELKPVDAKGLLALPGASGFWLELVKVTEKIQDSLSSSLVTTFGDDQ